MAAFNSPSIPLPSVVVVPNNETVGGTLAVTGATTLSSTVATGALTVTGNETVSGTLGVTGVTTVAAGSAAAPSVVSVTGTADTGVFFPAADTVAYSTAGSERLRIDSSGYVGIGTTSPTATLSVQGPQTVSTLQQVWNLYSGVTGAVRTGSDAAMDFGTTTAHSLNLMTNGTRYVSVSSGGNVGIGTTTPSTKFAVSSGINAGIAVTDGTVNTIIYSSTGGNSSIGTTSNHPVQLFTNNGARVTIDTSGNVLIGTTNTNPIASRANGMAINPTGFTTIRASTNMALAVDSTSAVHLQFYTDNGSTYVGAGNISSSGSVTAYNTASDYRLKQNVHPMLNALDRVSRLKPCTFEFIEGNQRSEGFIAHELQDVIPGAVTGEKDAIDDKGNPKHQSLDPSFIVATLTAAIQEQHALILGLMAKVEALEARG